MQIAHACLIHSRLQFTAVLKGLLNLWHHVFGYVDRNTLFASTAVQHVTAMTFSAGAHLAILANAGTLTKGKRALRYRPQLLYRLLKPLLDVIRRFASLHMRIMTHIHRFCKFFLEE